MQQIQFNIVHASDRIALVAIVCCVIALVLALFFRQRDRPNRREFHRLLGVTGLAFLFFGLSGWAWYFGARVPVPPPSAGRPHCVNARMTITGSTAMYPLIQAAANSYISYCKSTHITVLFSEGSEAGSEIGVSSVEDGTLGTLTLAPSDCICIGDSDVPATAFGERYNNLDDKVVAAVQYVLVVDSRIDDIRNLTIDDIKNIYENGGTYTNWDQVGSKMVLPIERISRGAKSGTRITFDQYVLGGGSEKPPQEPADQVSSNDLVMQRMLQLQKKGESGSIGYVSLQTAQTYQTEYPGKFTIVNINDHSYSDYGNGYPFWTLEHMYTNKVRASDHSFSYQLAQAFINYMGNTDIVPHIIRSHSFLTVSDVYNVLYTHY